LYKSNPSNRGMCLGMDPTDELKKLLDEVLGKEGLESIKKSIDVSRAVGDALAAWMSTPENKARDGRIVFGEVMAGLMCAAASLQSTTKETPLECGNRFALGVQLASQASPVHYLGNAFKQAVFDIVDAEKADKTPTPKPPTDLGPGWN